MSSALDLDRNGDVTRFLSSADVLVLSGMQAREGKHTRPLQKQHPPLKSPTLTPPQPIRQIIQQHILFIPFPCNPRNRALPTLPIQRWRRHRYPPHNRSLIIIGIIPEVPLPGYHATTRLAFHLHGEVGARVDGARHAVGVWDVVHVDVFDHDLDAGARRAAVVVDEDEFAAFAGGEAGEEFFVGWGALVIIIVIVVGVGVVGSRCLIGSVRRGCCCDGRRSSKGTEIALASQDWRHRGAPSGGIRSRGEGLVSVKDLRRSDICCCCCCCCCLRRGSMALGSR